MDAEAGSEDEATERDERCMPGSSSQHSDETSNDGTLNSVSGIGS